MHYFVPFLSSFLMIFFHIVKMKLNLVLKFCKLVSHHVTNVHADFQFFKKNF
jgi:hypothetical protein